MGWIGYFDAEAFLEMIYFYPLHEKLMDKVLNHYIFSYLHYQYHVCVKYIYHYLD